MWNDYQKTGPRINIQISVKVKSISIHVIVVNCLYQYAAVTKETRSEWLTDKSNYGILFIRLLADKAVNYFVLTAPE